MSANTDPVCAHGIPIGDGCSDCARPPSFGHRGPPSSIQVTGNYYSRQIKGTPVDVYDILYAFKITCPAQAHAIKKCLRNGIGSKSRKQDLQEAVVSLKRAIEEME